MRRPDHYYAKAKKQGFAARSIFKLKELNEKFRLFRPGMRVLDLGSAPGSWLQYAAEEIGLKGEIVGVDLERIRRELPPNAKFHQVDLAAWKPDSTALFDVVVSDMAPNTTGNRIGDHVKSVELCELALITALRVLRPGGSFVCKMYQGDESEGYRQKLMLHFRDVKTQKPDASRQESRELFFVAIGYRPK